MKAPKVVTEREGKICTEEAVLFISQVPLLDQSFAGSLLSKTRTACTLHEDRLSVIFVSMEL